MTPSDPFGPAGAFSPTVSGPVPSAPPPGVDRGLPDLASITSLAREMFTALSNPLGHVGPSMPSPPAFATPAHPTLPSPSPLISPPAETDLRGWPGSAAAAVGAPHPVLLAGALGAPGPTAPMADGGLAGLSLPTNGGSPALSGSPALPGTPALFSSSTPPTLASPPAFPTSLFADLPGQVFFSAPFDDRVPSFPVAHGAAVPATADAVSAPGASPRPSSAAQPSVTFPRSPTVLGGEGLSSHSFSPSLVPEARGLAPASSGHRPLDPYSIKGDFPILRTTVHGRPLIWLDNAATTQKPRAVIERLSAFYENENSNIHRAAHTLAARATDAYEGAREKVRRFLNAGSVKEIVFVRGTTEGINFIAQSWGRRHIGQGDEIVVTWLEHHANIVPWQQLCAEKGARLRVAPVDDDGQIILEEYEKLLGPKTKLVSLSQVSNALGTITPAAQMVASARRVGARVVVDGAQAVSHMTVDVQALACDFYVFSGHKVFGPTGIGAVYGREDVLAETPPWQGGGNMIADVTFEKTVYQPPPGRFEAGTGNIADAVGLGAALDYVDQIGRENIGRYEHELLVYATRALEGVPGLRLIGTAKEKAGVLSFVLDGFRTEDVGAALDKEGIAVRSGHHCAQPILRRFGLESTVRPSLAPYNTCEDIDTLEATLHRLVGGGGALRRPA